MRLLQIAATLVWLILAQVLPAQQGLLGEYFNGTNFDRKVMSRVDSKIDFRWNRVSPAKGMNDSDYSVRWTGKLLTPQSGQYVFSALVDDGIRLWVGGKKIIDAWGPHDMGAYKGYVALEANKYYDLKVEYYNGIFEGEITLMWKLPEGQSAQPVEAKYFSQTAPKPVASKPVQRTNPPKRATPAKPKPKPVPSAVSPKPVPDTVKVQTPPPVNTPEMKAKQRELELKFIYFVQSKDIILPESKQTLDDWVTFLQQKPGATIDVMGHTDDLGNAVKNLALSEQRAQLVADYLISRGLDRSRIRTKGYGETKPYFVNPVTEKERALNRRVEIKARQ
jgi:outer membrane protein OmpA-like peptidoglycan-associated protein